MDVEIMDVEIASKPNHPVVDGLADGLFIGSVAGALSMAENKAIDKIMPEDKNLTLKIAEVGLKVVLPVATYIAVDKVLSEPLTRFHSVEGYNPVKRAKAFFNIQPKPQKPQKDEEAE